MANRPTKLSRTFLFFLGFWLAVSFITGLLLWRAEIVRQATFEPPNWYQLCRVLHGVANPILCGCLGYLCFSHIPGGWKMRANRTSGVILATLFLLLVLTGAGLYYANERKAYYWTHLVAGLSLPIGLGVHWVMARQWVRKVEKGG